MSCKKNVQGSGFSEEEAYERSDSAGCLQMEHHLMVNGLWTDRLVMIMANVII